MGSVAVAVEAPGTDGEEGGSNAPPTAPEVEEDAVDGGGMATARADDGGRTEPARNARACRSEGSSRP